MPNVAPTTIFEFDMIVTAIFGAPCFVAFTLAPSCRPGLHALARKPSISAAGAADEQAGARTIERTCGRTDERTDERADGRACGRAGGWTSGRTSGRAGERMDARTGGRADE